MLEGAGFRRYGELVTWVVSVDKLKPAPHVSGVVVNKYRNALSEGFQEAERLALTGSAAFDEIGQPSGYEGAEGFDTFVVAQRGDTIVGFAQAQLPEGWINWMGVIPAERRRGIGRLLIAEIARAVRQARGTHVGADVDTGGPGPLLWRAVGAAEKGRRVLMINRGSR